MTTQNPTKRSGSNVLGLTLGSVGVVYGDIGTSPLYAFRESILAASSKDGIDLSLVLGVLSLILWALMIVVTLKYVILVLRADNDGEGGILSLMALAENALMENGITKKIAWVLALGMAGAALFYGDAIITPAISVLSAVEGLSLITDNFTPYIIPIALAIIILLFMAQQRGTEAVARFFGPVMVVWFVVLALGGITHIQDHPEVISALNPLHAIDFVIHHAFISFITLGAVFLTVTGAEALYADLGHFGKKPIRIAWIYFVMPALILNYLGQASLVLSDPSAISNPFFLLYPQWALLPMVILAGFATVIASQAVISGAFSLTHQAVQLGLLPRLHVEYTSETHAGQIYVPKINWFMLCGVLLLIILFRNSSNLASAYGIAVTGTMIITTLLVYLVMRHVWRWSAVTALCITVPLLCIDLAFFTANLTKIFQGGYMPLLTSFILIVIMRIWRRGSDAFHKQTRAHHHTMESLIEDLKTTQPKRVEGMAIYLNSNIDYAPAALLQNLKHNKVLHKQNILLTLRFDAIPYIVRRERITVERINEDFIRVFMHFGYMETPDVVEGLRLLENKGMKVDVMSSTFFISRRHIVPSSNFGLPLWQDHIFIAMANSATDAASSFHIPPSRVVELGMQIRATS